ncbi:MAG: AI-2E family transporter [Gemmatimonadota bacterium]
MKPLPKVFVLIVGGIVALAALRAAAIIVVPIIAGLFLAVVARPMQTWLQSVLHRRLQWLALVLTMLAMLAVVGAVGSVAALAIRTVASEFQERRPAIESQVETLRSTAAAKGFDLPLPSLSSSNKSPEASGGASAGAGAGAGAARGFVGATVEGLGGLVLALALAALMLAEVEVGRRRVASLGSNGGGREVLRAVDDMAPAFRRYVWVKSLTSAITGTATALASLALGVPLAWVWGLIAFLFEYVPTVGSLLAIAPPVLMALADGGPSKAAVVFLVIASLQILLGNVLDPRLEGKLMQISPVGVLVSVVFWGWMWGPVGALLAVPLTVAIVIASRHLPGARGVATLVSGDGVDAPSAPSSR